MMILVTFLDDLYSNSNVLLISLSAEHKISDMCKGYKFNWFVGCRKTKEGWPLLTVETEVNGDSKSINERVPSLLGSLGLSEQYKRFFVCLGCSSQPCTKYLFPQCTLFQFLFPHRQASWAGSHAWSPVS
jgi:hypothetical protein